MEVAVPSDWLRSLDAQRRRVGRWEAAMARQWRERKGEGKEATPLSLCLPSLCCCLACASVGGEREGDEEEEEEGPFTDKVGGLPLLPSPPSAASLSPSPSSATASSSLPYHCPPVVVWPLCSACARSMALLCQLQTPLMDSADHCSDGRLHRLIAVFACARLQCWTEGGEEREGEEAAEQQEGGEEKEGEERGEVEGEDGEEQSGGSSSPQSKAAFSAPASQRSAPFSRLRWRVLRLVDRWPLPPPAAPPTGSEAAAGAAHQRRTKDGEDWGSGAEQWGEEEDEGEKGKEAVAEEEEGLRSSLEGLLLRLHSAPSEGKTGDGSSPSTAPSAILLDGRRTDLPSSPSAFPSSLSFSDSFPCLRPYYLAFTAPPSSSRPAAGLEDSRVSALLRRYEMGEGEGEGSLSTADAAYEALGDAYEKSAVDGAFVRFCDAVHLCPDQVLRYHSPSHSSTPHLPNPPLIANRAMKRRLQKQPRVDGCPLCGHSRQVELQLMPNLLNHLNWVGKRCGGDEEGGGVGGHEALGMDWLTCVVWSCGNEACSVGRWVEEAEVWSVAE